MDTQPRRRREPVLAGPARPGRGRPSRPRGGHRAGRAGHDGHGQVLLERSRPRVALTAPRRAERLRRPGARTLRRGAHAARPHVAAINGHAFGAGSMLAMAHDFRVMREDRGYFCFPEVDIHIPFTEGMAALIQAKLTPSAAVESMTTGRRYDGPAAQASGIVDAVACAGHARRDGGSPGRPARREGPGHPGEDQAGHVRRGHRSAEAAGELRMARGRPQGAPTRRPARPRASALGRARRDGCDDARPERPCRCGQRGHLQRLRLTRQPAGASLGARGGGVPALPARPRGSRHAHRRTSGGDRRRRPVAGDLRPDQPRGLPPPARRRSHGPPHRQRGPGRAERGRAAPARARRADHGSRRAALATHRPSSRRPGQDLRRRPAREAAAQCGPTRQHARTHHALREAVRGITSAEPPA